MEPEFIDSLLERANRLLEAGQPAESLRCLDQVEGRLIDADDRVEYGALRAAALADMDQTDEALQTLEPLLEEFPESARLLGTLGVISSSADDLDQARSALEKAVALDPENEALLANLALVYEKLHDYTTAIRMYDRSIELGADLDWALERKATALIEAGESAKAKATLKRYLSLVPEDATSWISLGILHSDDEQYEDAFACFRRAAEIDPDLPSLRLNWGVSAVRAGQLPAACEQLDLLRRVDADSTRPGLLQAFILEEQGDVRAAVRCYTQTLAQARRDDVSELCYAFEMAMDFYARRRMRGRSERLFKQAYAANVCTVELCEAFRELTGRRLAAGYWFNLVIEADYRRGLCEVHEHNDGHGPFARYQRSIQIVARDRDEAVSLALALTARMGETGVSVCEFVREEALEDTYAGIYEVERESLVLGPAESEAT